MVLLRLNGSASAVMIPISPLRQIALMKKALAMDRAPIKLRSIQPMMMRLVKMHISAEEVEILLRSIVALAN